MDESVDEDFTHICGPINLIRKQQKSLQMIKRLRTSRGRDFGFSRTICKAMFGIVLRRTRVRIEKGLVSGFPDTLEKGVSVLTRVQYL